VEIPILYLTLLSEPYKRKERKERKTIEDRERERDEKERQLADCESPMKEVKERKEGLI
jgi:hypothetical protein